jgi:hypothetical protein
MDTKRQDFPGMPRQGYGTKYVTKQCSELSVRRTRDVRDISGGQRFFFENVCGHY